MGLGYLRRSGRVKNKVEKVSSFGKVLPYSEIFCPTHSQKGGVAVEDTMLRPVETAIYSGIKYFIIKL